MASKTKNSKPFSLEKSLRDLALLRASELDITSFLPSSPSQNTTEHDVDLSVENSHEFVQEARMSLKVLSRDEVSNQGKRVEDVRSKLEGLLDGIGTR